jgi:hypothetical protein
MTFYPYPSRSTFIFAGLAVALSALVIYLLSLLSRQHNYAETFQVGLWLLVTLIALAIVLNWALIFLKLKYHLNRNGLVIQWGLAQHLIPMATIEKIMPGTQLTTPLVFRGITLAGLYLGQGTSAELGPVKFHTTVSVADSLLVVTKACTYVISPHQSQQFCTAWQLRQSLGPTQEWALGLRKSWPFNTHLFNDRIVAWLLGLAAVICLALFSHLALLSPEVPHLSLTLAEFDRPLDHLNPAGLLILPLAGALILGVNTLLGSYIYYREKMAAYLLWSGTIAVQLALWTALISLTQ